MSARRCNRSWQVSVWCRYCSVWVRLSVGHSAQCRSSNSVRTSGSCANWEDPLQRRFRPSSKFSVILNKRIPQFSNGFPGLRTYRRRCRMTRAAGGLRHPEPKKLFKKGDNWFDLKEEWLSRSWGKKFCRSCAMQFGGGGATSGGDRGFCINGNAPSHTPLVVQ
jgi:hypothetical protein